MRIAARRAGGLAVVDWTADATPSVPRVDDSARIAFLVWLESTLRRRKPALICLESTLQLPYMRRLEAYKIVEEPRIVDSRPLRPLMPLESTPHSRLEAHGPGGVAAVKRSVIGIVLLHSASQNYSVGGILFA